VTKQKKMEALSNTPLISIIIPTRNEPDIRYCLEAALSQTYLQKEIIVVDDSTDDTPQIVMEYAERGARLIHRERNEDGCCGARNRGALEASGEIIVILNGDVTPKPDFLEQIVQHLYNGADYVLPKAVVSNQETVYARYADIEYRRWDGNNEKEWSEGFAARREAWLAVGGIPGHFPLRFCRDFRIGFALREYGFKKVIDETIILPHIAPSTMDVFCNIRRARGRFVALDNYWFKKMGLSHVLLRIIAKAIWCTLRVVLIIPILFEGRRLARFSARKKNDILPLAGLIFLDWYNRIIGEFQGWSALVCLKRSK
jgi:glycosyltransferase involved in cell wall biosynthesis